MSLQLVKLLDPVQLINVPGGLVPKGAYDSDTTYSIGDMVSYQGSSFVLYNDSGYSSGTVPTDTDYWGVVAAKGAPGGGEGGASNLSAWDSSTTYEAGQSVVFNNNLWWALGPSTDMQPDESPGAWVNIGDDSFYEAFSGQDTVVVEHNLNKYPAVSVLNSDGDEIVGAVTHDSKNQLTVTFNDTESGMVVCN